MNGIPVARHLLHTLAKLISLVVVGGGLAASASATTINYASYFLDERFNSDFPNLVAPGLRLQVEAGVSDSHGVPGNIASIIAQHTTTGLTLSLPYSPLGNFTTPTFGPYYTSPLRSSIPSASRTGAFEISVTNDQSGTVSKTTPYLRTSIPLVRARSIQTTGNILAPKVSWSTVPGADKYEVRMWDIGTGNLVFDSSRSSSPKFTIPSGLLVSNRDYAIGIISLDTDNSGNLLRRSFEVKPYSTTSPPPPSGATLTTYDFVKFSGAAYRDSMYVAPTGYSLAQTKVSHNVDVKAWVNQAKDQVVIGIGGSEQLDDYLKADSAFVVGTPTQNFIDHVKATADILAAMKFKYPDATIQLTGHSLGGAVAQTIADAAGLRAVTFDAPGAKNFVDDSKLKVVLDAVRGAGSSDIVNHRVYGDLVSTVGDKFGRVITYEPPVSKWIVDTFPVAVTKTLHLLDIIGERVLSNSTKMSDAGPTVAGVIGTGAVVWAATEALAIPYLGAISTGVNLTVLSYSVAWIDPGGYDGYLFQIAGDSPAVRTITFPFFFESEVSFDLEVLTADQWISQGIFQELDTFDFGESGVDQFRFFTKDYRTLEVLSGVEEFSYGLTFVKSGTVSASLTSFSTVPEPATIFLLGLGIVGICFSRRRDCLVIRKTSIH